MLQDIFPPKFSHVRHQDASKLSRRLVQGFPSLTQRRLSQRHNVHITHASTKTVSELHLKFAVAHGITQVLSEVYEQITALTLHLVHCHVHVPKFHATMAGPTRELITASAHQRKDKASRSTNDMACFHYFEHQRLVIHNHKKSSLTTTHQCVFICCKEHAG